MARILSPTRAFAGGRGWLVLWLVAAGGSAVSLSAEEPPPRPFLRKAIQLDDRQLAAVEKGEVVTKLLPTAEKAEVAAFGIVKCSGTPELLLERSRDVQRFRQVPQIPEIGRFSNPPAISDLRGLNVPAEDLAALKTCKPGRCDVKLGDKGLEIAAAIDWSSPGAEQRAKAAFSQALVDYVTAYSQGGTESLGSIYDKKARLTRAGEYRKLLANSPYLVEYVKEFNDYLEAYPKAKLANAHDVLYWTKDTFGLKPVVSAYHLTIFQGPRGALVSNKMIYSSHFFNASLDIMAATPAQDGKGMYLMNLFRTRLDPPTGMLSSVLMGKVRDGIETGVRENLKRARDRLGEP